MNLARHISALVTYTLAAQLAIAQPQLHACEPGTYQARDGNMAVVRPDGDDLRYLLLDGRRGLVGADEATLGCTHAAVHADDGTAWQRVAIRQTPLHFEHDGIRFFGRLLEPQTTGSDTPLVVLAHGSEDRAWASGEAAEPWAPFINFFPARGVSVFIFDKRGTGASGGRFNMNFHQLADDLAAAADAARQLATGRHGRFGLIGFSQGGWVAPLAARQVAPDFIVVSYGALYSPLEEVTEEVAYALEDRGFPPAAVEAATHLTAAIGALLVSRSEQDWSRVARLRRKYADAAWFPVVAQRGDWAGHLLRESQRPFDPGALGNPLEIPFTYDGLETARTIDAPQLWILGSADHIAPIPLTLARIRELQAEGVPIQVAVFPDADHGIVHFERAPDGTRRHTHFASGYFRLLTDHAAGTWQPPYGAAEFEPPR